MPTKTKTPTITVSLCKFDTGAPFTVVRTEKIGKWKPITTADYRPRGGTPLRDATALFLAHLDSLAGEGKAVIGMLADESGSMGHLQREVIDGLNEFVGGLSDVEADTAVDGKVLAVIFTDGLENASREVTPEALKAMVAEREAQGWSFIYLGANQDAWGVGAGIGLSATATGRSLNYAGTAKGTSSGLRAAGAASLDWAVDNAAYLAAAAPMANATITEDGDLTAGTPVEDAPTTTSGSVGDALRKASSSLYGSKS